MGCVPERQADATSHQVLLGMVSSLEFINTVERRQWNFLKWAITCFALYFIKYNWLLYGEEAVVGQMLKQKENWRVMEAVQGSSDGNLDCGVV